MYLALMLVVATRSQFIMQKTSGIQIHENEEFVEIAAGTVVLEGILGLPENATGVVLFAHGSGSSRLSPRNNHVARLMREAGMGTLLIDLLTVEEAEERARLLDIGSLAWRLLIATDWLAENSRTRHLRVGYFGASTGAAVAIAAAAQAGLAEGVPITGEPGPCAVVSRGGRPDLAKEYLRHVTAPTLLIVGGNDEPVIRLNEEAYEQLRCEKELAIVPGATRLFEEPGALEEVTRLAAAWFNRCFGRSTTG
jgi:pimeloyl-ACP methyl ester carboxylesterase